MFEWTESVRQSWDNLSDRERKAVVDHGRRAALPCRFGAVWTTTSALSEVEEDRNAIDSSRRIDRSAE